MQFAVGALIMTVFHRPVDADKATPRHLMDVTG